MQTGSGDGGTATTSTPGNRLGEARSPYLRQHADNPVHWWSWGPDALAAARRENRPILLSIGYAACHWCHVMAHESFEDHQTAAAMNAAFINIKVDREERPDIDHLYMTALQAMGQRGGWPLTMFLRPDGAPFWGGTYFPPEPRYGQPSFRQVLEAIRLAWADDAEMIGGNAIELQNFLARTGRARPGEWPDTSVRSDVTHRLLASVDTRLGGLNGAPKFPNTPTFRFLWQQGVSPGVAEAEEARAAVHGLLHAMIAGGIHDQIGGGFARYSTDAYWLAPHFEKMLYDNGQLLDLISLAHAHTPSPDYVAAADALVGWLQRELRAGDAFAASLDADSEGEEGRFYVWNAAEIAETLAPLGTEAAQAWAKAVDVTESGNWEGHTILRRVGPIEPELAQRGAALLFARREDRIRPMRDDKVLADWNALTVLGLARASAVFQRPEWLTLAMTAWRGVEAVLGQRDGRLAHSAVDGHVTAVGLLDDQAAGALATLALFEATGDRAWLDRAVGLAEIADRHFADPDGGYFQTADDAGDLPFAADGVQQLRPRHSNDGALPSGLSMLAEAQARLFHLTGDDAWRRAAEATVRSMAGGGETTLAAQPTLLSSAGLLENATTIVIDGPEREAWITLARATADPTAVALRVDPNAILPDTHPASGRHAPENCTTAWICRSGVCSLPIGSPDALLNHLSLEKA